MMIFDLLLDGACAAVAAIGFGAISNPPRRAFAGIALLAAIGHAFRLFLMNELGVDIASASLFASIVIGLLGLVVGTRIHCPITVLSIPAMLPMIPGMYAYKTVFSMMMFMQNLGDSQLSLEYLNGMLLNAFVTLSVIFMLAAGAAVPVFLFSRRAYSLTRRQRY